MQRTVSSSLRCTVVEPAVVELRSRRPAARPSTMVRVATGRDAADTAFLTTSGGEVRFEAVEVSAVADGDLPADDPAELVSCAER